MEWVVDNPFTPALAVCAAVAAVFALALYVTKWAWIGSIAAPAIFLVAYYQTYQKVPGFPPAGSVNKVFYVAMAAGAALFAIERIPGLTIPPAAKAVAAALLGAVWIAYAKLWPIEPELFALAAAIVVLGALAMWRIASFAPAPSLAVLAAVSALLAPVALFGGSSTSVGLNLGTAAGLAILSLGYLASPLSPGGAAIFGAGAGLLATVDSITLVSRKSDLTSLAVVAAAPFFAALCVRFLPEGARRRAWLVWFVSGLAALSPLAVIVALLFTRHESPL
jgi:hypothetical protein